MMFRVVLLAALALVSGCASRPTLAGGDWTADVFGGKSTFSFARDGSLKMDVALPIGALGAEGTYSETEDSVSLTMQRIKLPNIPIGDRAKKLTDQIVNRPIAFKVEWRSDDEVKLTPQIPAGPFGQVMILKRKAS